MSVVALRLRYQASAMAPPNWWGTPNESSISCRATMRAASPPSWGNCSFVGGSLVIGAVRICGVFRWLEPGGGRARSVRRTPVRSARRASGGKVSGSGSRARRRRAICSANPSSSMRDLPGVASRPARRPFERGRHAARRLDKVPHDRAFGCLGDVDLSPCLRPGLGLHQRPRPRRRRADRLSVEGPWARALAVATTSSVRTAKFGQGAGPWSLRGVHRFPDLEPRLGTSDHIRHTHYFSDDTHYQYPLGRERTQYPDVPASVRT